MNLESARFLLSPEGCDLARELAAMPGDVWERTRALRRRVDADRAAALLDQERGRASLRSRHSLADRLHCSAAAAAQASSEAVAGLHAARYAGVGLVVEIGAGCGVDSLALAARGDLLALECDPVRSLLLARNLEAQGRARVVRGRAPGVIGRAAFVFADPDRRVEGRRESDPERARPSLGELLGLRGEGLGVKLSPLADPTALGSHGELEFVSVRGELVEILLWTGALDRGGRRISQPESGFSWTAEPIPGPPPRRPGDLLYEPDPALVRSGLLGNLAAELGLAVIDPTIAFLSGPRALPHPLLRGREILAISGPKPREVEKILRSLDGRAVSATRRGFAVAPEAFLAGLRAQGSRPLRLVLSRIMGNPAVLVVEGGEAQSTPAPAAIDRPVEGD